MHDALVERARKGDEAAFEALTRIACDRSLAVAGSVLHDSPAAERAVEAAFTRAWRSLPRLREPERFEQWLETLVLEESAREGGAIRRLRSHSSATGPASLDPAPPPEASARSDAVLEAIARRVARTRQLGERPLFEGGNLLRVATLIGVFAVGVVASGGATDTLQPDIGAAVGRPTPARGTDGAVHEGDTVRIPEFREPLSFVIPQLPNDVGAQVDIDDFGHTLIAVRSGTSLIAVLDGSAVPGDLCRHGMASTEDALSSETTFESWVRSSTGIDVTDTGSFAIVTGTVTWFDVTTDRTCGGSYFLGPSEQHRLLLVPGRRERLLVMTGRDVASVAGLSQAALDLAASMHFD